MTKYNSVNASLSNSQLNELKSAIKNITAVMLRLSSNMMVILMMRLIFHINYY